MVVGAESALSALRVANQGVMVIYFAQAGDAGNIKIGFTESDDVTTRLATLQTGCPAPIRLLKAIPGTLEDEKNLHRRFGSVRVSGEWFKPIPELLAAIASNTLTCGDVEVAEKTVSIRVLTVGRKQFSKSLLNQLPNEKLFDWEAILKHMHDWFAGDPEVSPKDYDLAEDIEEIDIWGWVKGDSIQRLDHEVDRSRFVTCNWTIYVRDGILCKSADYGSAGIYFPRMRGGWSHSSLEETKRFLHAVYDERLKIPRWDEQLFIGV